MIVKLGLWGSPGLNGKVRCVATYTGPWQSETEAFGAIICNTMFHYWHGKKVYVRDEWAARKIHDGDYIVIHEEKGRSHVASRR